MQYFQNVIMFFVMIVLNQDMNHVKENVLNVIQHLDNRTYIKFGWSNCIVSFLISFLSSIDYISSIIIIIIFDRISNCCSFFFHFVVSMFACGKKIKHIKINVRNERIK